MLDDQDVKVTAYNGDTESYRITRLEHVIGYVVALADHYGNENLLSKINGVHDHKGTLTVTWSKEPTAGEKEFFLKAWESSIGDGADNVEHEVAN